jgi:hypothetical protein
MPISKPKIKKTKRISGSKKKDSGSLKTNQNKNVSEKPNKVSSAKRSFLKMAGMVGLGVAGSLMLPKKADALVFGSTPASNVVGVKDSANLRIDPAKETGGNLATVKTNTDPLVAPAAGGYVRQDSTGTIAKETGGNLAGIRTTTDKLTFDSSNQLLTASGMSDAGAASIGSAVNDQSIWMLRKIITLLKPLGMTTGSQSNRLSIDVNAITTLPTLGTVTTVTTVTTVSSITNLANIGNVNAFSLMKDTSRNAYANGIRGQISF